ncbi:MAG TPA: alkaline phosphatase family protein [Gaiellaceae bacterium]
MRKRIALAASALAVVAWIGIAGPSSASNGNAAIPHYQHIVEIMMENTSYNTIIGNPDAPHINALANTYGLATNYFGVTHPSEPNYVANVGGDFFGIQDDNQFYCTPAMSATDPTDCAGTTVNHTVSAQSIADQLDTAGLTWKGYFGSLPPTPSTYVKTGPGANGPYTFKYPSTAHALYASKHNPFVNFTGTQDAVANMVPDTQLATDAASNSLPNLSYVVPDQCNDMHGTGGCANPDLIAAGDTYVNNAVNAVMSSKQWKEGRNAIVITWDEDDFADSGQPGTGCCGGPSAGGGHVVTIVITNKASSPVVDGTAYNHYSLLRSMEDAFGLPCLANACDAAAKPMAPLFHP